MLLYNSIVQYFIGYQLCRINFILFPFVIRPSYKMVIIQYCCTRRYELSLHHKDNQIRNDHETFKNQNHVNSLYGSNNFFYGTKFE